MAEKRKKHRQMDRQIARQLDSQIDRQIDRQILNQNKNLTFVGIGFLKDELRQKYSQKYDRYHQYQSEDNNDDD